MSDKDALAEVIGGILAFFTVLCLMVIVGGWASARCWNLFAPDMFGLPQATVSNGVGLVGFLICSGLVTTRPRGGS